MNLGGERNEESELQVFIQLAKQNGFNFRTLDTFVSDQVKPKKLTD